MTGLIFDIKEFALYDGPGIRTTVFFKGCPLRCQWCHNPEGLSALPQLMINPCACVHCGRCELVCPSPAQCAACGLCTAHCPLGLRKISGQYYSLEDLAERLNRDRELLMRSEGGLTFSGGEPLMQWPFIKALIQGLNGLHTAIETSGYAPSDVFCDMMKSVSLVMMDIKAMDADVHKHYTGLDNKLILHHARMLCAGDAPFIIRLPIIPGVNDHGRHYEQVAALLHGAKALIRVELLPYHQTSGGKYAMVQREYRVDFAPDQSVHIDLSFFSDAGIKAVVL